MCNLSLIPLLEDPSHKVPHVHGAVVVQGDDVLRLLYGIAVELAVHEAWEYEVGAGV